MKIYLVQACTKEAWEICRSNNIENGFMDMCVRVETHFICTTHKKAIEILEKLQSQNNEKQYFITTWQKQVIDDEYYILK